MSRLRTVAARARTLLGTVATLVAHRLAFLLPRDDDLWVFSCRGGERFEGNAKYLFLHVAAREDLDVRPVWLSRNAETVAALRANGYEAADLGSVAGLATLLRAGRVFLTGSFSGLPLWPTGGARVVQLWHGVTLKRISADGPSFRSASRLHRLSSRYLYRQFDRITVTTRRLTGIFCSAFRTSADRVSVTGYPRNDALLRPIPDADIGQDRALDDEIAAVDGPVVAYLPTYRDSGRAPADALDVPALESFLAANDATLLVKFHPFETATVEASEHIRVLPDDVDVYPLLRHVDALVTDYSSVYFDYLLLDRPVVFYAYDRATYEADHGLYFDYEAAAPGQIATDFEGLLAALERCLDGDDGYADARAAVRDRMFDHTDGRAAARVVDRLTDDASESERGERPRPGQSVLDSHGRTERPAVES